MQSYRQLSNLRQHIKIHVEKIGCSYCLRPFNRVSDIGRHLRAHTGDKPETIYDCSQHTLFFPTQIKLHIHMRGNTREKPYTYIPVLFVQSPFLYIYPLAA